jgi:hypothetical protein
VEILRNRVRSCSKKRISSQYLSLPSCKSTKNFRVRMKLFQGKNVANRYRLFPYSHFRDFSRKCLTFITFKNSISYSLLRDGVCMSTSMKRNTFSSVWNTPCLVWYSGVCAIVDTISLSGKLFWIPNLKRNLRCNSKSVKFWEMFQ